MINFLKSMNQLLTWRMLSLAIIPTILLMSISKSSIESILALGLCGVIASVLSLRGQEGDV